MFQPTMISPVRPARDQVASRNEESGGIPPLDIERYLEDEELAVIAYKYDRAPMEQQSALLIALVKPVLIAALVTEYSLEQTLVEEIVEIVLARPDSDPSNAFDENTVDHTSDFLQFAFKKIRVEIFTACMEKYQKIHRLYVPVEKLDYFPLDEVIRHMKNPGEEVTREEAEFVFQRDPMQSFSVMYAMSTHQVYETVPLPEFRPMMLPMSYQLWKQVILNPDEKMEKAESITDTLGSSKILKLGMKNQSISK